MYNSLISILHALLFIKDGDDYIVEIPSPHTINLTDFTPQINFFVHTINDTILEDFEEDFTISISLDNPNVLVDTFIPEIEMKILDDEGWYYFMLLFCL